MRARAYVDSLLHADPDLWRKWVAKLDDKGFFKDAAVGSEEHKTRTLKALAKFKEKFGDVKSAAVRTPAATLPPLLARSAVI